MILQPVILSGGSGTRLWPMSREKYPKQLLSLVGGDTMLQATARRLSGFKAGAVEVADAPMVVCNEEYRFLSAEQMRSAGVDGGRILLEPFGRNTAPALTLAALLAIKEHEDALLLVMPADHVMRDLDSFHEAIAAATGPALDGAMVTFGIVPDRPETGYGYLEVSSPLAEVTAAGGLQPLVAFVEKPPVELAEQYLAGGRHLWNSGLFMMRASTWMRALRRFAPDMATACEAAFAAGSTDRDFVRIGRDEFTRCPSDSIDYAVMEKLASAPTLGIAGVVVPLVAGWSDVGAWDAVWASSPKDADGNSVQGDVMLEDTHGSLVITEGRLVACLGLDDMIVVDTPDALLVANKNKTQDIKRIVTRLKAESRPHADNHRKVHRPWGYYDSIDNGSRFQVKRIVVRPGASLSLQMHHHRAEHWIVVSGTARVTRGDEIVMLSENQSTYIPLGTVHRLENPGVIDLEMIEVQSGSYLGEDDIVRLEDVYGRLHAVQGGQAA